MTYLLLPPFLASLILGFFSFLGSDKLEKYAGWVASLCLLVSFGSAASMLWGSGEHLTHFPIVLDLGSWIKVGLFQLDAVFKIDELSLALSMVVTGVGFLVHLYSVGYMSHDESQTRYFAYLSLFCGFMLILITGSSMPLVFIGWEGVGLCSFLLIGFWFKDRGNASAGKKAFIVNRIGDAGFLIAMFLILKHFGSLDFSSLSRHPSLPDAAASGMLEWIMVFVFIGCVGKSAQFPLYIWLPDAMAGPTPVSALIHAATMVTAGVYLLCRMYFLLKLAPLAMDIVAATGAFTALFSATIACVQTDIKKVLAYSTVSQLGFMVLAVGSGAPDAGIYHLVTHAYFKALLFLGAGSVIHALNGEQNIQNMGRLITEMPLTTITFFIGYLSIVGFPLFSGWVTKDAILHAVLSHGGTLLFTIAFLSALLTAAYMTRLYYLVFLGNPRQAVQNAHRIHEGPWTMSLPLVVLALLAAIGGLGSLHFAPLLEHTFHAMGISHLEGPIDEIKLALYVTAASMSVVGFVYFLYHRKKKSLDDIGAQYSKALSVVRSEYGVNRALVEFGTFSSSFFSKVFSLFDRWVVDGAVNWVSSSFVELSRIVSKLQTGRMQTYSYAMVLGCILLVWYLVGAK